MQIEEGLEHKISKQEILVAKNWLQFIMRGKRQAQDGGLDEKAIQVREDIFSKQDYKKIKRSFSTYSQRKGDKDFEQ